VKNFIKYILVVFIFYGCTTQPVQENIVSYKESKFKKATFSKTIEHPSSMNDDIILEDEKSAVETIAIVFPSKSIGKYSIEATNTAMSFLINKNIQFNLEVIDINTESKQNVTNVLDELKNKNIYKVVFFATNGNVQFLNEYENIELFKIYLPLVNKTFYENTHQNIVFGGIDYMKQFDKLDKEVQNNLIEIYDDSMIGMILHEQFLKKYPKVKSIKISGKNPKYERILKRNKSITNSTVILNMPIVKSSIVLSQLRAHDMNATKSLSTQINYSPLLFVLTQKEDRKDFYVTNAIDKLPDNIEEMNLLFENDILYNWVNYSTILGLEYLLTDANKLFNKINIVDNQIEYNLKILKAQENKFVHYRNVK
jgi:hypothetical protein